MTTPSKPSRPGMRGLALLILAGAALTVLGLWIAPAVTRENVERWIHGAGSWGPLVLLGVQMAQILVAPIPGVFVPILAGFLYGPIVGPAITIAGTFVGSLLAYAIGRRAGRPLVARWIGDEALEKAHRLLGGRRWVALIPLFLVPLSPSDALCFLAGIIGLQSGPFALAVLLGRAPKDAALAFAGAGLLHIGS